MNELSLSEDGVIVYAEAQGRNLKLKVFTLTSAAYGTRALKQLIAARH